MSRIPLSQQLRRAIEASGMTRKAICRRLGLHVAQMSRFMAGTDGFGMKTLDRLAAEFLEVRPVKTVRGEYRAASEKPSRFASKASD